MTITRKEKIENARIARTAKARENDENPGILVRVGKDDENLGINLA